MPGVVGNIRRLGGVRVAAADPGRSQEPFHALEVAGGVAEARAHVSAPNEFGAGRFADLFTGAVVAVHGAEGVRAVTDVVARLSGIVSTRIADAVMNGIVPV